MDDSFEIIQMIFGFAALLLWFFPGRDLSDIAKSNTRLINFAWVNIPLVYTQLVQIAVHIYFLFTLFGTQV